MELDVVGGHVPTTTATRMISFLATRLPRGSDGWISSRMVAGIGRDVGALSLSTRRER